MSLARAAPTTGTADILSTPAGATVSVDGRPAGRTPLSAVALKPGARRVDVALEGHEPWSGTVDVVAGQKGRVEVRLKPIPAAKPEPTPEPVDTARVYSQADVDTPPKRRSGESPSYPRAGAPKLKSSERVSVTVRFVVTETGDVQDVSVVESAGKAVDAVVVQAVKGWKYEPPRSSASRYARRCCSSRRSSGADGDKLAKLIVNPTSANRREILLSRSMVLTIGRDPSNDLVLADSMVSRRHAVVDTAARSSSCATATPSTARS